MKFFSDAFFGDSFGNWNVIQNIQYSHMLLCIIFMLQKKKTPKNPPLHVPSLHVQCFKRQKGAFLFMNYKE